MASSAAQRRCRASTAWLPGKRFGSAGRGGSCSCPSSTLTGSVSFTSFSPLRGGRLLLCVRFLTGLQGTRCHSLLFLGRAQGRGSRFAAVSKQLQVHHLLLAPGTPVGKADIVRVALSQQGKARLGQLKGPLDPCGTGPGSSHRQAGAIGLIKGIAVGVLLTRQQADQCLHQGADTGTHDILPCRGIACMARRLQTHGRAVRTVQFRIIHFDHFCLLLM